MPTLQPPAPHKTRRAPVPPWRIAKHRRSARGSNRTGCVQEPAVCRVQSLAECEGLQGAEPACACQAHVCARAGSVVCVPRSGFTRRAAPLSKAMAACMVKTVAACRS